MYSDPEKLRAYQKKWREENRAKICSYSKKWRDKNKPTVAAKTKKWAAENPDRVRELRRRWYANNPEKSKEMDRLRRLKHADKIRERNRRYQQANRDKIKAWHRKSYLKHRTERLEYSRITNHNRRAAMARGEGLTYGLPRRLLASQNFKCVHCPADLHKGYHMDHIVALSKGGPHKDENIQLLCPACNLSKFNLDEAEWLARRATASQTTSYSESPLS